jgi:hypothetical protein
MKVNAAESTPVAIHSQNPKVPRPLTRNPIRKLAPRTKRKPKIASHRAVGSFFAVIL